MVIWRPRPFDDGPISDLRTNKWRLYALQAHERFEILGLQFPIQASVGRENAIQTGGHTPRLATNILVKGPL